MKQMILDIFIQDRDAVIIGGCLVIFFLCWWMGWKSAHRDKDHEGRQKAATHGGEMPKREKELFIRILDSQREQIGLDVKVWKEQWAEERKKNKALQEQLDLLTKSHAEDQ